VDQWLSDILSKRSGKIELEGQQKQRMWEKEERYIGRTTEPNSAQVDITRFQFSCVRQKGKAIGENDR